MSRGRRRRREGVEQSAGEPRPTSSAQAGETQPATSTPGGARRRLGPVLLATAAAGMIVLLGVGALVFGRGPSPTAGGAATERLPGVGERPSAQVDATGRLLVPLEAGLSVVRLPSREIADVVRPESSGAISAARWAPDGRQAAYALYHVRPGDSMASSEIYLTDLGGEARLLVGRDRPGAVIEAPAWAPDGRSLYFGYVALENQAVVRRIERVDVADGTRGVISDGMLPELSPDGAQLALVRSDRNGDSLVVARDDGSHPRTLIPAGRYSAIGAPRFSPDGRTLAVPVSGVPDETRKSASAGFLGLLGSGVAHAHGDPWEVYLLPVEGGEPRRLTRLLEDELAVAWSPEGDKLAVYGSRGLYLVDRDGRTTFALDRGGYGGIDWAR